MLWIEAEAEREREREIAKTGCPVRREAEGGPAKTDPPEPRTAPDVAQEHFLCEGVALAQDFKFVSAEEVGRHGGFGVCVCQSVGPPVLYGDWLTVALSDCRADPI